MKIYTLGQFIGIILMLISFCWFVWLLFNNKSIIFIWEITTIFWFGCSLFWESCFYEEIRKN